MERGLQIYGLSRPSVRKKAPPSPLVVLLGWACPATICHTPHGADGIDPILGEIFVA